MTVDYTRIVQVSSFSGADPVQVASGLLVSTSLVLTTSHILGKGEDSLRVVVAPGDGRTQEIGVAEVVSDPAVPFALLKLGQEHGVSGTLRPRAVDRQRSSLLRAEAIGFPKWKLRKVQSGLVRDSCHAVGTIAGLSGRRSDRLDLAVENGPAVRSASREDPWSGMSGAPTFVVGRLVGIVSETYEAEGTSHLSVAPLSLLSREGGPVAEQLVGACGWPTSLAPLHGGQGAARGHAGVPTHLAARRHVGRESLVDDLDGDLSEGHLVPITLVGAPGFGKSSLASQLVERSLERGKCVAWLDLTGAVGPHDLVVAVAQHLEISEDDDRRAAEINQNLVTQIQEASVDIDLAVLDGLNSQEVSIVAQSILPSTRLVITTNRASCSLGRSVDIGPLTDSESTELLRGILGEVPERAPELVAPTQGWPILVELMSMSVRRAVASGMSVDMAVDHHLHVVRKSGASGIQGASALLDRTLGLLTAEFTDEELRWTAALGLIIEPNYISTSLLEVLWNTDGHSASSFLLRLSERRICSVDWERGLVHLHEVIHSCIADTMLPGVDVAERQRFVTDLLASRDLHEGYLLRTELTHLASLGRWPAVMQTVSDLAARTSFHTPSDWTVLRLRDAIRAEEASGHGGSSGPVYVCAALAALVRRLRTDMGDFVWSSFGVETIVQLLRTPSGLEAVGGGMDGAHRLASLASSLHAAGRSEEAGTVFRTVLARLSEMYTLDGIPDAIVGSARTLLSANRAWSASMFEMASTWTASIPSEPVRVTASAVLAEHLFVYSPEKAVQIVADVLDQLGDDPDQYIDRLASQDEYFDESIAIGALAPLLAFRSPDLELILQDRDLSSPLVWLGRLGRSEDDRCLELLAALKDEVEWNDVVSLDELLSMATSLMVSQERWAMALAAAAQIWSPGRRARVYADIARNAGPEVAASAEAAAACDASLAAGRANSDWLESAIVVAYAKKEIAPGSEGALVGEIADRLESGATRQLARSVSGQLAALFPGESDWSEDAAEREPPVRMRHPLGGAAAYFASAATAMSLEMGLSPQDAMGWVRVRGVNPWRLLVRWSEILASRGSGSLTAADVTTLLSIASRSTEAFYASRLYARALIVAGAQGEGVLRPLIEGLHATGNLTYRTSYSRPLAELLALYASNAEVDGSPEGMDQWLPAVVSRADAEDRTAAQRGALLISGCASGDPATVSEVLRTGVRRPINLRTRRGRDELKQALTVSVDDIELDELIEARTDIPIVSVEIGSSAVVRQRLWRNWTGDSPLSMSEFGTLVRGGFVRSVDEARRAELGSEIDLLCGPAAISLARFIDDSELAQIADEVGAAISSLGSASLPFDALTRLAERRVLDSAVWAAIIPAVVDLAEDEATHSPLGGLSLGMWLSRVVYFSSALDIECDRISTLRESLSPPASVLWDLANYLGRAVRECTIVDDEFIGHLADLSRLADLTGFGLETLDDAAAVLNLLPPGDVRSAHLRIALRRWPGSLEDLLRLQVRLVSDLWDAETGPVGLLHQSHIAAELSQR